MLIFSDQFRSYSSILKILQQVYFLTQSQDTNSDWRELVANAQSTIKDRAKDELELIKKTWNSFAVVGQCDLDSVLIPPDKSDPGFWPAQFQKKLHSLPVLIRSAIKLSIGKMRDNLQRIFRPHLCATAESDLQSWYHFLAAQTDSRFSGATGPRAAHKRRSLSFALSKNS